MSSQELKHYVLKTKRLARQTRQMKKKKHIGSACREMKQG